jgi:ligand-binding sensor domain-containing protein
MYTLLDSKKEIIKPTIRNYYVVCTDVTKDKNGNMWVANYQLNQPDNEGGQSHNIEDDPSSGGVVLDGFPVTKYRHFSPKSGDLATAKISCIFADDDGWVWTGTDKNGLQGVYYGDDPFDTSRPTVRRNLMEADGIYALNITAIHSDRDGYVWVGTQAGLNRITKLSDKSLKVDAMNQLLLTAGTEIVSIEVDRLNNKWIGTANGLVKINALNESVEVYTTENSGLLSNNIKSLKYDDSRDVLWIGTDAGLNKFHVFGKKTAEAGRTIRVYPNPFSIWGTDSRCTFDNLMLGGKLRIFTFSGVLVNEFEVKDVSSKGIPYVTWNGRNLKNEPVASGVYFIAGRDKSDTPFRDKMVIIRR